MLLYIGHVGTGVAVEYIRIRNISLINCTLPHVHWKFSTTITVGTFAAFFSYSFLTILILMPVNGLCLCFRKQRCCRHTCNTLFCNACSTAHWKSFKNGVLSPFYDTDSDKLSAAETKPFFINYFIAYILFSCSFSSSIIFTHSVYDRSYPHYNSSCWISRLNIAKVVLHFSTELCAIQSCFIFSKVVYKVTNKLKSLASEMDRVDFAGEMLWKYM